MFRKLSGYLTATVLLFVGASILVVGYLVYSDKTGGVVLVKSHVGWHGLLRRRQPADDSYLLLAGTDVADLESADYRQKNQKLPNFHQVHNVLLFIGYPRSGHTLVACLVDAHPHVVLSNEYNVFHKWPEISRSQKTKEFLFGEIYKNAIGFVHVNDSLDKGHKLSTVFNYSVPNQWNGRYDQYIQVIGDKKGGGTTRTLGHDGQASLAEIENAIGVPVSFLHVIRNPFDNIATLAIRSVAGRDFISQSHVLNDTVLVRSKIQNYFSLIKQNARLRLRLAVLDVHSADVIEHPKESLRRICRFLRIECDETYLQDCASIVFENPSKTRNNVVWTDALQQRVTEEMKKYPFLSRYSFRSD